ncbi:MAG: nitronate monooxygenase, partial [Planctomycetes bacterium]|nr:nitronate monooxygenase [Planctomycetota bacterium]
WTEAWDAPESPGTLPMPLQFMLTADAQSRMQRYANKEDSDARELVGMPVGQIVGSMNSVRRTRDVIQDMVTEFIEVTERLSATLAVPANKA